MRLENVDLASLRDVAPVRHRRSSLSIHPYFGKVDPSLATKAIELLSIEKETVLDPFCGSGTVVHDALRLGRNAVGWDSSPLAILISTAKVLGLTHEEERELLAFAEETCPTADLFSSSNSLDDGPIPAMPRIRAISDWFGKNALRELAHIRTRLNASEKSLSPVVFLFAKLAFSRIITSASLQKGESSYCRSKKPDVPGRVLKLYRDAVVAVSKAALTFSREQRHLIGDLRPDRLEHLKDGYCVTHGDLSATLTIKDSRFSPLCMASGPAAHLVVTSPPYLMSWDYGLYHKFRFYWLGFDLDKYEETEIGRHLRRKDDDVPRYIDDMSRIFFSLYKATLPKAHLVMVNALSVVNGEEVDTNRLLIQCAASAEWQHVWDDATIGIPGPHHGMYHSLTARGASAPGSAGKKEHVLVFKKPLEDSNLR
jgi:SAM-dependent methyltransferase